MVLGLASQKTELADSVRPQMLDWLDLSGERKCIVLELPPLRNIQPLLIKIIDHYGETPSFF